MTAASLTPMAVAARLARLRGELGGDDALLVTSLTNIRYLTGFTGSAGMLFVLPGAAVLLTDGRYGSQAQEQLDASGAPVSVSVAPTAGQRQAAATLVADHGVRSLGLEAAHVTWARQRALASEWFPAVELEPTVDVVERLRAVKDDGELQRLQEAARIADEALGAVRDRLGAGPTEAEFGRLLDFEMRRLGASGPSFETIVAAGPNAAKPHHRPGARPVGAGEAVVVDFGAMVDGYCSDMTRTVWVGRLADAELRKAYDLVLESQAAGVAAVRAGTTGAEVDRACRDLIAAAGWGDRFVHGTGHGVGLDIHEAPSVSATSTDTLVAGHVVTVEPGVYIPGLGGVRIEDTVVVTADGCRPLTSTPKDRI
ncbi:MAG TPA: Xaa-Pro peptidase family protein [Acidimicrobiales bacterium]|nr:Xaa-Pro peptidase family protein [Acidimicrobiales bacterium]